MRSIGRGLIEDGLECSTGAGSRDSFICIAASLMMTFYAANDKYETPTMKSLLAIPLITLIFLGLACSKKDIADAPVTPPGPPDGGQGSFTANKSVKVEIPAGSAFDFSKAKLVSLAGETSIGADGSGKIYQVPGSIAIAYVFDKDNQPILAGFVHDSLATIDPTNTAKVLLYLAHDLLYTNNAKLTRNYLASADKIEGVKQWIQEFSEIFKTDPLTLSNKSFIPVLKARMEKFIVTKPLDIHGKPADIVVDGGDKKSGLQVIDDGLSNFSINNYYRRRSHAFLYKMKSGNQVLQTDIKESTKADRDFVVDPVGAINSVTGEIGKWIEDKDQQSAVVKTGPNKMELDENEPSAEYAIRIVGPGFQKTFLTNDEFDRLSQIYLETFALDVVLPGIAAALSVNDMMATPVNPDLNLKKKLLEIVRGQWKAVPEIYDDVVKGEYKTACWKLLENLYKDGSKELLKEIAIITVQIYSLDKSYSLAPITERIDKMVKILGVMDAAMTAGDIARIRYHHGSSNRSDQWKILARSSQVRLEPSEAAVLQNQYKRVSAIIKNLQLPKDVHAFYEWTCTGKFGEIKDNKGHSGGNFASSDSFVTYLPSTAINLKDEDNLEYIYVTAKLGDKIIGRDTTVLNVRKNKEAYVINPSGVTLSGKEKEYSSTRLYLEPADGDTKWKIPNSIFEYKIIWSTSGKYGKIRYIHDLATTMTVNDDDDIVYECLDKDTKEGKETVTARIYSRLKGLANSDYRFHSEATATININNDDKKRILHITMTTLHRDKKEGPFTDYYGNTFNSYFHWAGNVIEVPQDPQAKSYSLRYVYTDVRVIPQPVGESWAADKLPFNTPPDWVRPALNNGVYTIVHSWGSSQGGVPPTDGHADGKGGHGTAEVIITLK
jgi:hypothetical protein